MGGFCIKTKHAPSEISIPQIKQTFFLSNENIPKESLMLSSTQMPKSSKRKYSKTAEDVDNISKSKVSLLIASKKSWKSKRSVKVK